MIDLTELTGQISVSDREQFLNALFKIVQQLGDPYQMPDAMVSWLDAQNKSGVDSYYQIPVGYGSMNLSLRFTFKKQMIIMEFIDPYGTRLMELRLHAL